MVGPVSPGFGVEESQELAWAPMLNPEIDLTITGIAFHLHTNH